MLAVLNSTAFVTLAVNDRLFTGCTGIVYTQGHLPDRRDDPDDDRRHQRHHVDGRADHRARRRQRHVGDDLHPDRRDLPGALWASGWPARVANGWIVFLLVIALGLVVMAGVIFVEQSQRRIPVQYAKRMVGRRMFGGTTTYIPIKVNQAGVIPVIFASSLLYLPALYAQFRPDSKVSSWIQAHFVRGDHPVYMLTFFFLIVFFCYFYVAITFNPEEVADNMKKYGGFIPGIRAGKPTENYLAYVLSRLTFPGSLYLGADRPAAVGRLHLLGRQPELPIRRYLDPDHRRRRSRHRQTDREPAPATQLRRVLALMRLLIMGPPGAGKGTQAKLIGERYGIPAISTGDIFRAMQTADTPLARQVREIMASGGYISDEITNQIVADRLAQADCEPGFLLDGYPRTLQQVVNLDAHLESAGPRSMRSSR